MRLFAPCAFLAAAAAAQDLDPVEVGHRGSRGDAALVDDVCDSAVAQAGTLREGQKEDKSSQWVIPTGNLWLPMRWRRRL